MRSKENRIQEIMEQANLNFKEASDVYEAEQDNENDYKLDNEVKEE